MRNYIKKLAAVAAALTLSVTLVGCSNINNADRNEDDINVSNPIPDDTITDNVTPPEPEGPSLTPPDSKPDAEPDKPVVDTKPTVKTVTYLMANTDGLNIRSGAGTNYAVRGTAQKSTLYSNNGQSGGWYKTGYKNSAAYLSAKYCESVDMRASEDERIEAIIAEGSKLLGTAYVFGAVRYHDGGGNKLKSFDINKFDCSSLMQYIFYKGAGLLLNMNTRTQVKQGKTVNRSQLQRGDLMFFTNASRKHLTGVERIGHVALFLGDNWILHTASDFAKIEQISSTRWSYFIQAQRLF